MMENENSSFTFWANMKEAIETYKDEVFKYKLYDAVTEYGLYGVKPENDGTVESQMISAFVQAMVPTLDKSRGYRERMAEAGKVQKVSDEQLHNAIREFVKENHRMPTRFDIVRKVSELYKIKIDERTISRRVNAETKQKIFNEEMKK